MLRPSVLLPCTQYTLLLTLAVVTNILGKCVVCLCIPWKGQRGMLYSNRNQHILKGCFYFFIKYCEPLMCIHLFLVGIFKLVFSVTVSMLFCGDCYNMKSSFLLLNYCYGSSHYLQAVNLKELWFSFGFE